MTLTVWFAHLDCPICPGDLKALVFFPTPPFGLLNEMALIESQSLHSLARLSQNDQTNETAATGPQALELKMHCEGLGPVDTSSLNLN